MKQLSAATVCGGNQRCSGADAPGEDFQVRGERYTIMVAGAEKKQRSGKLCNKNIKNTLDRVEMWIKERLGQKVDRLRRGPPGPDRILVEPTGAFEHHDRPGAVLRVEDFLRLRGLL